jgi:3,4-dihydroxy 2-butanone 4-phosphate synthase/GTP cyclohydrolase II
MLNTIEEAISDIKNGKLIIVVDNEDRENEGDFICAAETITPEIVNFMATQGRGLICAPIETTRADELQLPLMVRNNTSLHETAFTVSVDLIGHGCSTGISTYDRALTIKALSDSKFVHSDFARPGHIFPLRSMSGGVLRRTGHTEATIDLARLAGLQPAGALVEILNDDGTMARLPHLLKKAQQWNMKIISIHDLVEYRLRKESLIKMSKSMTIEINGAEYQVLQYEQLNTLDHHIAIIKGNVSPAIIPSVRVQYCDTYSELLDVLIKRNESLLSRCMSALANVDSGVLLLLNNKEKLIDPFHRIQANEMSKISSDQREIGIGAQILKDIGINQMKLITNNPVKAIGLEAYGIEIVDHLSF